MSGWRGYQVMSGCGLDACKAERRRKGLAWKVPFDVLHQTVHEAVAATKRCTTVVRDANACTTAQF